MEIAKYLLFEKTLPKHFWAEVVNTLVYLLNMLPTKALVGKTPFKALFGVKPLVTHLNIFGCVCYIHVPEAKRDKLEERVMTDVFLGYNNSSKTYKVFDLQTQKVVARNVKFSEIETWDWSKKVIEPKKMI